MGRWQNKLNQAYLSSPQNLLNTNSGSSVGSVATPDEHLLSLSNNGTDTEHHYLVSTNCLPLYHCSDEPYGDTAWIQNRLKRVALHKRVKLADEYSCRYLHAYAEETNEIRKENKARRIANHWLLLTTKYVSTNMINIKKEVSPCKT